MITILKIPSKILQEPISLTAKVVFAYYQEQIDLSRANHIYKCFDSNKYIAKQLTTKSKEVKNAVKALKDLKLIEVKHQGVIRSVQFPKTINNKLKGSVQIPVMSNLLSLSLKPASQLVLGYILAHYQKHTSVDITDDLYHQGAFLNLKHNTIKDSLHKLSKKRYIKINHGMITPVKQLNSTNRLLRWKYRFSKLFSFSKQAKNND